MVGRSKLFFGRPGDARGASPVRKHMAPLAFAMAFVLACGGMVAAPKPAQAAEADATLGEPAHTKTIKYNGDGTYTLFLSVTGDSRSEDDADPIDVVLVMDTSNSMKKDANGKEHGAADHNHETERMVVANKAANALVDQLLTDRNAALGEKQIRVSVVNFASTLKSSTDFSADKSIVANAINGLTYNDNGDMEGGTNWEAALKKADSLSSGRSGAKKYIIFVSDGDPTYRLSSVATPDLKYNPDGDEHKLGYVEYDEKPYWRWEYTDEVWGKPTGVHGSGTDNENYKYNYYAARDEAKSRGDAELFSVSTAAEASYMDNLASDTNGRYYDGTNEESLNKAFSEIAQIITKAAAYQNVKINDTLSQWVDGAAKGSLMADGKIDLSTAKYMVNGVEDSRLPKASLTSDGRGITWDLSSVKNDNGVLPNKTYTVSFVVAPNQAAFDEAANEGKDTSLVTNGTATVDYEVLHTTNGKPDGDPVKGSADYDSPTVTVPVSKLTLSKVWADNSAGADSVTVKVADDKGTFSPKDVVLSKDNGWIQTITVAAGPVGHKYSFSEVKVEGYTSKWDASSLEFKGTDSLDKDATVTNSVSTGALTLTKQVSGGAANVGQHYTFTLTCNGLNGEYPVKLSYSASDQNDFTNGEFHPVDSRTKVTFTDGKATLNLKHDESAVISNLPGNKTINVVEMVSGKAGTSTKASGGDDGEQTVFDSKMVGQTQTKDYDVTVQPDQTKAVTFTNNAELQPTTGVSASASGPMVGLLATAGAGVAALAYQRRHVKRGSDSDAWKE